MDQQALDLGGQNTSSPQFRVLHGVHETFARQLETGLSAFLQTEIPVSLREMTGITAGDYRDSLQSPDCLIGLKIHPRPESMVLRFESPTIITLLELLLGGKGGESLAEGRELTEIEWSLLEEIVRVVARALGEAWRTFLNVEFEVESLGSDPARLPCADPMRTMLRIAFELQLNGQTGSFEICVPQAFFEAVTPAADAAGTAAFEPPSADVQRNLKLLENAVVELEVSLRGPKLAFQELVNMRPGQVLIFDYPLGQPVSASANGAVDLTGHIVSSGRKRAFQVAGLP
jgi:flagellar motor switch protein FliM